MNYYEILGLPIEANAVQIREAYLYKVNILHPDRMAKMPERVRGQAEEELKAVNRAYEILSNPVKRRIFDSTLNSTKTEQSGEQASDNSSSTPTPKTKPTTGKAGFPKVEVYPKTIILPKGLPYVWQKCGFLVRNVGGPYSKLFVSEPPQWLRIKTNPLESNQKLPMEVKLEAMGTHWGEKYSTRIRIRLDNSEATVSVKLEVQNKPRIN